MSARGLTLAETIVAAFIAFLALGVLVQGYVLFSRQQETPMASMTMEQSTLYVMRMLQRDLSETNIQSIRSLPNQSGVVMASPRDSRDVLQFSQFGTVQWQKFVSYQVQPFASSARLPAHTAQGKLIHDESAANVTLWAVNPPPVPFSAPTAGRQRVVAQNVKIDTAGPHQGLFVYYPDALGNPVEFDDRRRGEPVCVHLSLMDSSTRTGKVTTREIFLTVKPRN